MIPSACILRSFAFCLCIIEDPCAWSIWSCDIIDKRPDNARQQLQPTWDSPDLLSPFIVSGYALD